MIICGKIKERYVHAIELEKKDDQVIIINRWLLGIQWSQMAPAKEP